MSDSQPSGGDAQGGKGGGRKRKRPFRSRRRGRKPQGDQPEVRQDEEAGNARPKSRRSTPAKSKSKGNEASLDPVNVTRRDRRRRKRSGDRIATPPQPEPVLELDIEPKRVFVYTHVLRPSLRDAYEYRAEHFSHTGRTLADFRIDLSPIFAYPDGDLEAEPVIDLHIGGSLAGLEDDDLDEDTDDAEARADDGQDDNEQDNDAQDNDGQDDDEQDDAPQASDRKDTTRHNIIRQENDWDDEEPFGTSRV